jgi:hypothetical protein
LEWIGNPDSLHLKNDPEERTKSGKVGAIRLYTATFYMFKKIQQQKRI